nr:MAG TPA: hypothetical protein [Caudoviricetes sp.]DAS55865.1 MAG TPA: hypothetical protein [Caudoviricetes sp.]
MFLPYFALFLPFYSTLLLVKLDISTFVYLCFMYGKSNHFISQHFKSVQKRLF